MRLKYSEGATDCRTTSPLPQHAFAFDNFIRVVMALNARNVQS